MPDTKNFDLFERHREELLKKTAPLADRMRPRTLDEFVGQDHIIGDGRLLRRAIQVDQLSSLIFYGPPGTGKTTLARIIANTTKAQFLSINAVLAGVKEIRESIDRAQKTLAMYGKRTILFVDEVHRFNKSQQDALLPHVENGILILIGATTENPYFEVNKALVSRSRVFQLRTLDENDLKAVIRQALNDKERGYGNIRVDLEQDAEDHLVKVANGDARAVLNALELAVETTRPDENGVVRVNRAIAEESIQQRAVLYDKDGDAHYDTISAFIKSVRGSDPDAALYWMAKMIYAGEDPRFIFRRMMILACEDVGMADPKALEVVVSAAQAFDYVGLPEGRYHLAHACLYLSTAPKSNSSMAFFDALNFVSQEASDDVPSHLRDASRDKEGFGHGAGYLYPHAYRDHWVAQQYLPSSLQGKTFYQPSDQGYEMEIAIQVNRRKEAQLEAMIDEDNSSPFGIESDKQGQAKWLERTLGSRGVMLGRIREKVLDCCSTARTDLVLDLNARTGLLTFEALRRAPEGGVWALVHDQKAYSTLSGMAERLDALSRPQIILTNWESFDSDLKKNAGKSVRFDCIVGRSVLSRVQDKIELFSRFTKLLGKNGRLAIAETVPSEGQRISELVDFSDIDKSLEQKFLECENELFSDKDDSMMNWTVASLEKELGSLEGFKIRINTFIDNQKRRLKAQDIDFWFRKTTDGERKSLGERLMRFLPADEVEILRKKLHRSLANRESDWKVTSAVIFAAKTGQGSTRTK